MKQDTTLPGWCMMLQELLKESDRGEKRIAHHATDEKGVAVLRD